MRSKNFPCPGLSRLIKRCKTLKVFRSPSQLRRQPLCLKKKKKEARKRLSLAILQTLIWKYPKKS